MGDTVGSIRDDGYITIKFNGVPRLAHRLAWFYIHGKYPVLDLDHIDGNKANNKISNLREVPHMWNNQNEKKARVNSQTGVLGVSPQWNKFQAQIHTNGKRIYLGVYETVEQAYQVYLEAKRKLHKGNTL